MALSTDRHTPYQDAELIIVPVAADAVCYAGGIACANASGYATPGAVSTTLTYLGRFEEHVDATDLSNGAVSIAVRRKKAFKWKNSNSDPVTQASLGKVCYILDDETVAATSATNTRSVAGKVVGLESDGVWVE